MARHWYGHSVEAIFVRALGDQLGPALRTMLAAEGLQLGALEPMYTTERFERFLTVVASKLYPSLPPEQSFKELGEKSVSGYGHSLVGQATLGMLKLLGPRQGLKRLQQNLRSANDYSEVRLEELAPGHYRVRINDPGALRFFHHGLLLGGQRAAGAPDGWVDLEGVEGAEAVYALGFSPR